MSLCCIYTNISSTFCLQVVNSVWLNVLLDKLPLTERNIHFSNICIFVYLTSLQQTENGPSSPHPIKDIYCSYKVRLCLLSHLLLLSPLPAQLSVGSRHRLNHESGGHVAGEERAKDKTRHERLMSHF